MADAADDLFGAGADAAPAADDLFGGDAAPADDAAEPAGDIDNLFGDPPADSPAGDTESTPPADPPAGDTNSNLDDLFGGENTEAAPAGESSEPSIDDLFGKSDYEGELPAPVSSEPAIQVVAAQVAEALNPLSQTHERTWIDNTGRFKVNGRLIEINSDNVRLLKDNGRTCTVPNGRLCDADEAYVDSIREQIKQSQLAMLSSK